MIEFLRKCHCLILKQSTFFSFSNDHSSLMIHFQILSKIISIFTHRMQKSFVGLELFKGLKFKN